MTLSDHLIILPILLPMLAGVVLTLIDERHRAAKLAINIAATVLLVAVSAMLLGRVGGDAEALNVTYRLGDWPAPFAIVLVGDRLAALMVMLASVLALAAVTFSIARWHRAGAHFHTLFQLLLMGLNGAFLTGDLFNLFVFFEILLAASYGLALHGSGKARVRAGLHYIAFNLATSALFLIGVSLVYGVAGTLNMADLAARMASVPADSRPLLDAGLALLGVAFLVKAGMWPLSFWLPTTYAAASAPVAAVFAIMSKVGVYVLLRMSGLLDGFAEQFLFYGGLATMIFGTIGILSSQELTRMVGFIVLLSSGTTMAMLGYGDPAVTAGAMYYLVASTLGLSCLFLVAELMERGRLAEADIFAVTLEAFGDDEEVEHNEEIGVAVPATMILLGLSFAACGVLLAGMPPLGGFIGKFAMLQGMLGAPGGNDGAVPAATWALMAVLILSGLATMIAMLRTGINRFWAPTDDTVPRVRVVEIAPIAMLLGLSVVLVVLAGSAMGFMQVMSDSIYHPDSYVETVLGVVSGGAP
ncbi:MAG TPA: monovalent cation/H+ antiporter subunit D [Devosia sp.]|nr:monovalent cation/H+ antiporter subunit D [Devosia sp.]